MDIKGIINSWLRGENCKFSLAAMNIHGTNPKEQDYGSSIAFPTTSSTSLYLKHANCPDFTEFSKPKETYFHPVLGEIPKCVA